MTILESQQTISKEAKDAFWKIIEECLISFHGLRTEKAQKACLELHANIESLPIEFIEKKKEYGKDLFYHNEPFYVACNIAEKQLSLKDHYSTYQDIISKFNTRNLKTW